IAANIAVILTNRSWTLNIFQILRNPNKSVKWVIGGATFFLALVLNIPFLLDLFQFNRISLAEAFVCIGAGFLAIFWFELYKLFQVGSPKTH
ncbi:MAG: cation transporting ATPase C-terminal domain-containing protein, partial [Bacteroidia bacterium]|nr:cation transporting ATPase C-terminal domain-containing protein [Bacteroidia bacterium]